MNCSYSNDYDYHWPEFTQCQIINVKLTEADTNISFSGNVGEKLIASVVSFEKSTIDVVPESIISTFPILNGISIINSTKKNLPEGFFDGKFVNLKYLKFNNNLRKIHCRAFFQLTNLEWCSLAKNQLNSIPLEIFEKNVQLRYISLEENQLHTINSNLFKNLIKLEFVDFFLGNSCVDKNFHIKNGDVSEMMNDLRYCF